MAHLTLPRPARGLLLGALLAALSLAASPAAAAGQCPRDAGGGCERELLSCSPPTSGLCYTVKVGNPPRELQCQCLAQKPPGYGASHAATALPHGPKGHKGRAPHTLTDWW